MKNVLWLLIGCLSCGDVIPDAGAQAARLHLEWADGTGMPAGVLVLPNYLGVADDAGRIWRLDVLTGRGVPVTAVSLSGPVGLFADASCAGERWINMDVTPMPGMIFIVDDDQARRVVVRDNNVQPLNQIFFVGSMESCQPQSSEPSWGLPVSALLDVVEAPPQLTPPIRPVVVQ